MNAHAEPSQSSPGAGVFPTTHWSVVVHAGAGSDAQAHTALEVLCRQYWYPLYTFIRRQGKTHHDAEDCTQEFLARLLGSDGIARARPERGRFRTFLLASMRNFLVNEWQRAQAAKRGGGQAPLSLEFDTAAERFAQEPADPGLTPEQVFDRNWAVATIDRAMTALRVEYEQSGRGPLFAALGPLIIGDPSPQSHATLAAQLRMNAHAFTVALQRARRRLGERLRADVAETVADGTEVDAELHHLIAAVASPTPTGGG